VLMCRLPPQMALNRVLVSTSLIQPPVIRYTGRCFPDLVRRCNAWVRDLEQLRLAMMVNRGSTNRHGCQSSHQSSI